VFEKAIFLGPNKNKGFSFLYAAGLYYHFEEWLSPGLEFYRNIGPLHDLDPPRVQQHYIFPVVRGELPGDIEYNLGPGIGLRRGSDRLITKFSIEFKGLVSELWQAFSRDQGHSGFFGKLFMSRVKTWTGARPIGRAPI
jgi:hypothetical protein